MDLLLHLIKYKSRPLYKPRVYGWLNHWSPSRNIWQDSLKTLNDFQKLLEDINWLWTCLRYTKLPINKFILCFRREQSIRQPTTFDWWSTERKSRLQQAFLHHLDFSLSLYLLIFPSLLSLNGILTHKINHWNVYIHTIKALRL